MRPLPSIPPGGGGGGGIPPGARPGGGGGTIPPIADAPGGGGGGTGAPAGVPGVGSEEPLLIPALAAASESCWARDEIWDMRALESTGGTASDGI